MSVKMQLLQLICCVIKLFHFLRKMACDYNGKTPIKTFFDGIELAKNYYIDKGNKSEDIEKEKENDEYILHQLDFMFANYGQRNEK